MILINAHHINNEVDKYDCHARLQIGINEMTTLIEKSDITYDDLKVVYYAGVIPDILVGVCIVAVIGAKFGK